MRYRYKKPFRYRLPNPPKALLKARMDNIAIVPASMLVDGNTEREDKYITLGSSLSVLCGREYQTAKDSCASRGDISRARAYGYASLDGGGVYQELKL
jgi:hypothetical protein